MKLAPAHAAVLLVIVATRSGFGVDKPSGSSFKKPLAFSCFDEPFLGVFAETLGRESFADVELRLVDPLKRSAGYGNHKRPIPASSYGKVVDDPNHPEKGRLVAVEVCNARQGTYEMTVWERTKSAYRISVRAGDGKNSSYVELLYPAPEAGRACRYKFRFRNTEAGFRWLDGEGHVLPNGQQPSCVEMQRASRHDGDPTDSGL